jgi:N utilization substance protein A
MKSDFIIALTQLAAERHLPREIVLSAIEDALISAYKKDSITAGQNISVKLDPGSGDLSVYVVKTVVKTVEDSLVEISLSDAKLIKLNVKIDEELPTENLTHTAGRIAAQTAKQVVVQRLREAEREIVFKEFADKEGEVFTVTVQRTEPKQVVVELNNTEGILPVSEQAPFERYRTGQKVKVLLQSIRRSAKGPEIIVSRADKLLLRRLFEMEVPEIYSGAVEIVNISREAGSRSKVAVVAKQDGVDAVGSCVGLRGIRIQNIVNELHGEKIDVVQWNMDPATYIANALSPSQVGQVQFNKVSGSAIAVVPERHLSLAIGKEGQNARLAAALTGWKIDIKSDVAVTAQIKEAPAAKIEEAPVAKIEEAPAAKIEEAPVAKIEEAPAAKIEEAPAAKIEEAPAAKIEEAPAAKIEEAPADESLLSNEIKEPIEPDISDDQGASLHDLPDNVWSIRAPSKSREGVIRFAEDIDELKRGSVSAKKGSRKSGSSPRGNQFGRGKKSKSGRKR